MQVIAHCGELIVFILQAIDMLPGKLMAQTSRRHQCTQGIDNDHHIDALLRNGADKRWQVTEGSHNHGQ
ncbi:hypothetical protein D3C87_2094380 [compost metagenome]